MPNWRRPHLGEVNAQRVGFVLPADVDLGLCAATFALDLRTSRQSEGRLLGDELRDTTQEARSGKKGNKKRKKTHTNTTKVTNAGDGSCAKNENGFYFTSNVTLYVK